MADSTTTALSPLRRRMIDDMMLCNLSPPTQLSGGLTFPRILAIERVEE